MARRRRILHSSAFERALAAAPADVRARDGRYAAAVELARSLAEKMDQVEASGGLNAAGKPDTTTATQYLRALEALGLTVDKAPAARRGPSGDAAAKRSLDAWRRERMRVVG